MGLEELRQALEPLGLNIGTLLAALGAIVGSYFAAKFGASESKRQFKEKQKLDRLVAAGELLSALHLFKRSCEDVIHDCESDKESNGQIGKLHSSLEAVHLSNSLFKPASLLGPDFVADVIMLESKFFRADDSVSFLWQIENEYTASEDVIEWCAALSLDTLALMRRVALAADVPLVPSFTIKETRLKELAKTRASDKDDFPAFQRKI